MIYLYLGIGWVVGATLVILMAFVEQWKKGAAKSKVEEQALVIFLGAFVLWPVFLFLEILVRLSKVIAGAPVVKDEQGEENK